MLLLMLLLLLCLELLLVLDLRSQELLSCHLLLLWYRGGRGSRLSKVLHDWPSHTDKSG